VSAGRRARGGKKEDALGARVDVEKRAREARDAARVVSATPTRADFGFRPKASRKVVE